jgi:cyanophycin synthetase
VESVRDASGVADERSEAAESPGVTGTLESETGIPGASEHVDGAVDVLRVRALRGPSLYASFPVLKITVDPGRFANRPSSSTPGFAERLAEWLPGIQEHECSLSRRGGFLERVRRGTYLPHILEHVVLELQAVMGFPMRFGLVRRSDEYADQPHVYDVVVAYEEEEPAREAVEVGLDMVVAAFEGRAFDAEEAIERLRDVADTYRLGPSTAAIVAAARQRDIPVVRLTETSSLVQLGYGVHQRRIWASQTSETSAIAVDLCQVKPLTNTLLRSVALPVPEGQRVHSADEAWEVAQEIGLPVVVKPEAGNHGKGVSVNLRTEAEVREGFELARDQRKGRVLVEQYVEGADHRLLVVGGRLVAAARRDPAAVTGDGRSTIEQLVREANKDPRRREGHSSILTRIRLDAESDLVLQQQGFTRDSVPEAGLVVRLRSNGNLSTGGTATDVTDEVHPSNARVAELAVQVLNLDIAGIDVICKDIRQPLRDQRGAIVEVNASPGLRMHLSPTNGKPRDVGTPIVEMLFPKGAPARIPIIAVTGTNGKTTTTRLVGHMFETAGHIVGATITEGVYVGGERIVRGDSSGPKSARTVLLHPGVEVAVLETARGGIIREGLAFDACDVAVVTNLSPDHIGISGVGSLDDLQRIKQVVVQNTRPGGAAVLNAEDPLVAEMAPASKGRVIYFSTDPANPVITAHTARGGECVLLEDGGVTLVRGTLHTHLLTLDRVPFTGGGRITFQVQNALAAVAAAWGAGLNPAAIARGLTTFRTDPATTPGRFNVMDVEGVQVVVDYAHNQAGLVALGQALEAIGKRHTILAIGLPGDRQDADLRTAVGAIVPHVDELIFFDQYDRRGREVLEVPRLLEDETRALRPDLPTTCTTSQADGITLGWERARMIGRGCRLVVLAYQVDAALKQIVEEATTGADACAWPVSSFPATPAEAA